MYKYITNPSEVEKIVPSLLAEKLLAYDTETTGLDPHTDKVILASISTRKNTYVIDTRDVRCLEALRPVLEKEDTAKLGFYLQFDYCMTKGTAGIDLEGSCDLRLAEKCLGAGIQWSGYDLEEVTRKYLKQDRDKSLQKSFVNHKGDFTEAQLAYAAQDTSDLFLIYDEMMKPIMKQGLGSTWKRENRALASFADAYFYGMKIDIDAWKKIMVHYQEQMDKAKEALTPYFEPYFDRQEEWNFETGKQESRLNVNFNSQPSILYALQRMGIKVDGELIQETNDDVRKKISTMPVIQALDKFREAQKALGTYGQPYLDAIHPVTGRIHPRKEQYGTETGRETCTKPNVLNIPREEFFRHAFITDPDRMISTVDWSGAELLILTEQSGDPLMVEGFNRGVDFHCYVASMLFNREVTKKDPIRNPTKSLNFGLAYGMGPTKLFNKLNGEGHKISLDDCIDLFKRYKETFTVAIEWLNNNKHKALQDLEMTNVGGRKRRWLKPNYQKLHAKFKGEFLAKKKDGVLTTEEDTALTELVSDKIKGQKASIEREGANFMIQSMNVEWLKDSMYTIRKECKKRNYDARFYNSVYDETVLDVAKKDSEAVHELQKKIMIDCGQAYCKKVPVKVEGHLMPYWTK